MFFVLTLSVPNLYIGFIIGMYNGKKKKQSTQDLLLSTVLEIHWRVSRVVFPEIKGTHRTIAPEGYTSFSNRYVLT